MTFKTITGCSEAGADENLAKIQMKEEGRTFCRSFTAPDGYLLEIDDETVLIKGPYCEDLGKRLNRIGYWDGAQYKNRKCFVVSLENAKSLKRIFSNWQKGKVERDIKAAKKAEEKNLAEINLWLGYVENSAKEGRIYQNGIDKLKSFNINRHPGLAQKMKEFIELAHINKQKEAEKPQYGQSWKAEKTTHCSKCNTPVNIGDSVHYRYQNGTKNLEHVDCDQAKINQKRKEAEAPYPLSGGSGYGCHGWTPGQILESNEFQRQKGFPEFLFVVESSKRYFKDDGMSFGVGDESGYVHSARCREATPEETVPLKEEIVKKAAIKMAQADLKAIKNLIMKDGEYPDEKGLFPDGTRYFDTQNIYGGGDWFVVGMEWIWYIKNNGMDGDNWAHNNIRTGGAGAIGWRIPFSEEIVKQLDKLSEIIPKQRA